MSNELIFLLQIMTIASSTLVALYFGKEAIVAFICICSIVANIFVVKQITLFGFHVTASDAFSVGATFGLNVLQEYYGRSITRRTIGINFFLLIFFALIAIINLRYQPNDFDTMQLHFLALFAFMPRIIVASFTTYLISQTIDYLLYGWLKSWWHRRFLMVRNYLSISISQLVDTVLFSILGLYGIVYSLSDIITVSYSIKIIAIALTVPFIAFSRIIPKPLHKEQ